MSRADRLCDELLKAQQPQLREQLLTQASKQPECLQQLIDRSLAALASAPEETLRCAAVAVELADRLKDPRGLANAWWVRAMGLWASSRHAEALNAFDAALAFATRLDDRLLAARIRMGRIDSLCLVGRYDEAIALGHELAQEFHALGEPGREAKVLANLGSVYFRRDRYVEGADCFRRSLDLLATSNDELTVAAIQQNYANVLAPLERVDEAIDYFGRARTVFEKHGDAAHAAMVDANVGFLYLLSGEYSPAMAALNRARQHFAAHGRDLETAKCDADLADVYRAVNLLAEAEVCYQRAITVFERIPLDYERGRAELGLATVLLSQRRTADTLAALKRADEIFAAHNNSVQRASVRLVKALALREQGDLEAVRSEAETAMRTFARHRLLSWAAEAQMLMAEVEIEQGEDARPRLGAVSKAARRYARGWLESRAECGMGDFYLRRGDLKRALSHFKASVGLLEAVRTQIAPEELHVSFLRDKLAVYEKLVAALLRRGNTEDVAEAFEYVERSKSRLLLERVQSVWDGRRNVAPGAAVEVRDRLATLRAELSRGYYRLQSSDPETVRGGVAPLDDRLDDLMELEQEYRATLREVELQGDAGGILVQSNVHSADLLRERLRDDEVLVEYYCVDQQLCAFVLSKRGLTLHSDLAPLETVTELARRLRYQLQKAGIASSYVSRHNRQLLAGTQQVLESLYALLLRPLEHDLYGDKVVLIPYGALHGLPIHAFYDGTKHALDRYEFVYAPSAAVWYTSAGRGQQSDPEALREAMQHALIMGIPEPGIEHVLDEVIQLACRLPGAQIFCGNSATVEAFQEHAGTSRLIHLATHALFRDDNPLFSGLQFANGWLLARDLYEQNLDCELATLSACRTGVSSVEAGDELFGLIRGFLAAGTRSLAVSLWPTDDAATAELMVVFYTRMAQGMSKAAALRAAQRQLRDRYPHPYHWAAFALVGDR